MNSICVFIYLPNSDSRDIIFDKPPALEIKSIGYALYGLLVVQNGIARQKNIRRSY